MTIKLLKKISWFVLFLAVTQVYVSCSKDEDDPTTGGGGSTGGGNTSSLSGVWVRTAGASGDETDIAIGGISGEASNRVYMCEYKGAVGIYKGTLSGNTITWDEGLPDANVRLVSGQLELSYPSVSFSIPTLYDRGSWAGHCGPLSSGNSGGGGGGGGSTTGNAMFWASTNFSCGTITVNVNNSSGSMTKYYTSGSPDCGAVGCANFTLEAGTYSYSASCSSYTWSGSITVKAGGCSKMQLTN
jgi:hypothetical protein